MVFGHVPLGIWYLIEAHKTDGIGWTDWLFGILYLAGFLVIFMMIIGYRVMVTKKPQWAFAPEEVDRFNRIPPKARRHHTPPLPRG